MQARAVSFHTLRVPEGTPVVVDTNQDVVLVRNLTYFDDVADTNVLGHEVTIISVLNASLLRNAEGVLEVVAE